MANDETPGPRFSIVTAVHNVARYLGDFIAAVDGQTFPSEQFEVIAVDDGSTDDSLAVLQEWRTRRPDLVTLVTKENGGQASARNAGLLVARGDWITFTDPDDVIEPDYLAEVDAFLRKHPETAMVATNRLMLMEQSGDLRDTHPLRGFFTSTRLVDLRRSPDHFHGSAPAAFFRRSEIVSRSLRFDLAVRPNFEDGHFCCHYLLDADAPLVGFVASARYHYRRRQDASSTLQGSLADVDRYTKVLRNGYLELLETSRTRLGTAPEWLQNFILYELSYYLSTQEHRTGGTTAAVGAVADEFHGLMAQILDRISDDVILTHSSRPLRRTWRYIFLHAYRHEPWHQPYVVLNRLDESQGLVRLTYYFTGDIPDEQFISGNSAVLPAHAKVRHLDYHGHTLLKQRIVWLSSRQPLRVELNGCRQELRFDSLPFPTLTVRPGSIRRKLGTNRESDPMKHGDEVAPSTPMQDRLVKRLAQVSWVRRRFARAWVLMDRVHDADDSGEVLFRYLRENRPDVNAWFVVERDTPDWHRIRTVHADRVVAHGSLRWKLLMLNCRHLISSHADSAVINPVALRTLGPHRWRYTFLQHGVIKDDLSAWLNTKDIDTFITSTPQEHASIAGDGTPYVFTTRETKLTGLPRFDEMLRTGQRFPPEKRDLVLVAPTWRSWLVPELDPGSQKRNLHQALSTSEFSRKWAAFLRSPELQAACDERGLRLAFLPHPNFQAALPDWELPSHVLRLGYGDADVREYFARAAVFVTDYSSIAFNAAYIERPVVYFQFDVDRVLNGGHVGRRGYFDYEQDGFGPVALTVEDAVAHVLRTITAGVVPADEYLARIERTFPHRDGRCCERVVEAIAESTKKARTDMREPTPVMPEPAALSREDGIVEQTAR